MSPQAHFQTALLILDAINPFDFEGAEQIAESAIEASAVIAELRSAADALGVPTVYVNDNYGHWDSEKAQIVERMAKASSTAAAIVGRLAPRPQDHFIIKPHFSGFYATNLSALLDTLEIGRLILTGYAADICVLFTAADGHMRGYDLWIPEDATASETDERKRWALNIAARSMGATTLSIADLTLGRWTEKSDA